MQPLQDFLNQMLVQTGQSVIKATVIAGILSTISLVFKVMELFAKDTSWEGLTVVLKWAFGMAAGAYFLHWFIVNWNQLVTLMP